MRIFSKLVWLAVLAAPLAARGADPRADFLKLIDRPHVDLAAEAKEIPTTAPGLVEFHFTFASDAQNRVPGVLLKKGVAGATGGAGGPIGLGGRHPVVIALHGTGGTKADELPLLRDLANKGFIAVAIDGRYHGERTKAGKGSAEYEAAIVRVWKEAGASKQDREHPFYYDSVWNVMRLIDYLETRPDVDKNRIGLYGVSKGGIETYLTAAVDPRVKVAVPCIGMQSFQWALENNSWQARVGTIQGAFDGVVKEAGIAKPDAAFVKEFYARVAPKIDSEFDGPSMITLIAPRPLMTINGDSDARTPLPGLKLCEDAARAAYKAAGAEDHFVQRIELKTGHKVNADAQAEAVAWFVKWLGAPELRP